MSNQFALRGEVERKVYFPPPYPSPSGRGEFMVKALNARGDFKVKLSKAPPGNRPLSAPTLTNQKP